ncbi:uncharacterized protein HHUB_4157 (plasmid) [Halobacterium hubeiense]|uniref:PadR family transcription regulator n=1 Tax=Halobacterium hubeiense TaxID=1407499 RepID=A0A0U5H8F1_9EURY|nr:hypothetical protein [Halobacterium hubeiense]CQH63688.1 uncharacterized protein HHUB_4157 [Halobacterium hubeiense]
MSGETQSYPELPVSPRAVLPAFQMLSAPQRDTFVAVLQLVDDGTPPSGMRVVSRVERLGQPSSQQTIYRALSELQEYGYLRQFDGEGRAQQYVPTRNGVAAFWSAREMEARAVLS